MGQCAEREQCADAWQHERAFRHQDRRRRDHVADRREGDGGPEYTERDDGGAATGYPCTQKREQNEKRAERFMETERVGSDQLLRRIVTLEMSWPQEKAQPLRNDSEHGEEALSNAGADERFRRERPRQLAEDSVSKR